MENPQSHNLKTLFCISHVFPPLKNPLANRVYKLSAEFQKSCKIIALTDTKNASLNKEAYVYFVASWYPKLLFNFIEKLKLSKLLNLFIWPDKTIFWLFPALFKGYQLCKQQKPDVILVFMMPYSASLVGIGLKWITGLPLVLSLDDSLSCTDMHPVSPSWWHHLLDRCLEKFYVYQADALIYVSQVNMELVKRKQSLSKQSKFHLIRCGVDLLDFATPITESTNNKSFKVIYTGGMNGWYHFSQGHEKESRLKKLYQAWNNFGCYKRAKIDYRSSSPVFVGKAIQQVVAQNSNWENKIQIEVYGNSFSESVVQSALRNENLTDIISVFGSVSHSQAIQLTRDADLLLITLPDRVDRSSGGRISCKTYEYLMTDRPILAAVPKGENWNYLQDKPGVWLVEPTDIEAMGDVISYVVSAKFSGCPLSFDRTFLKQELSYVNLAEAYMKIFDKVCSNSTTNNKKENLLKFIE
jgi:glycosyltransferase involved in cell wall biosynthesis